MRFLVRQFLLIVIFSASTALAGIGAAVPATNLCPANGKFKANLGVLNVNGDGSLGAGACSNFTFAETVITCTSKEKAGKTIDIAIEYFDSTGATISTSPPAMSDNLFCGIGAGQTVTFHTVPPGSTLPQPWAGASPGYIPTGPAPEPIVPCTFGTTGCFLQGSARILATSKKIHCTATFIDLSAACEGNPGVAASKKLPIINKAKQAGD